MIVVEDGGTHVLSVPEVMSSVTRMMHLWPFTVDFQESWKRTMFGCCRHFSISTSSLKRCRSALVSLRVCRENRIFEKPGYLRTRCWRYQGVWSFARRCDFLILQHLGAEAAERKSRKQHFQLWSRLPVDIGEASSRHAFKRKLKTLLTFLIKAWHYCTFPHT